MDPGQEKLPLANRGAALWGDLVVTVANYPPRVIATNKETGNSMTPELREMRNQTMLFVFGL